MGPETLGFEVQSDGAWHEKGYAEQVTTLIQPGDVHFTELLAKRPDVMTALVQADVIVFQVDSVWYRLERVKENP